MIAFLAVNFGLSLPEIGALTLPQARTLIEEHAQLTGAQPKADPVPMVTEAETPGGEILLDALYDAVKARMGGI